MASDGNQENSTSHHNNTYDASSTEEFFDRERWHDVESGNEDDAPENNEMERASPFSAFSVAILLLITVIAGGAGIIAAYLIPILFLPKLPLLPKPDFRNTPAVWIGYAENGAFFCDINEPSCFAASRNGQLFIGNSQPPSLHVFSANGKQTTVFPLESKPMALAWGEPEQAFSGKLLIAHKDIIAVYSPEGRWETSWKLPDEKAAVWSLAVADDSVFAADSGNRLVYRFDEKGKVIETFGGKAKASLETESDKNVSIPETPNAFGGFVVFNSPMTLTVSRKTGLLHVANPGLHRIETFTRDGYWEPSLSWQNNSAGVTGFAGCCNPVAIDTFDDGRLLTAEKAVTRVKVYHRNGRLDCVVAGPEILGKKPLNVPQLDGFSPSINDEGKAVFIAVLNEDNVVVFDPVWRIVRLFVPVVDSSKSNAVP